MPKRSRAEASEAQIVVNITNNYAPPAPVPEDATATEQPTECIDCSETDDYDCFEVVSVKKRGKLCSVYVWYLEPDGTIKGGCHNCSNKLVDFDNFAPPATAKQARGKRVKWDAAYLAYKAACAVEDRGECVAQLRILNQMRNKQCRKCTTRKVGPATAPPAPEPERRFETDNDCFKHVSVNKNGKWYAVYVWYSARDGTLKGGCHAMCRKQFVDFDNFAPADGSSNTQGYRNKFDAAHLAYKAAHAAGDHDACVVQLTVLEKLRTKACFGCRRDPGHMWPGEKACKEWYDAKRKAAAAQNDGCAHQYCRERGPGVWCILTAEHGTNPKKRNAKGRTVSLSAYTWWAYHGGVPAMEEEAKQIEKWTCRCCALLDPSSNSANRYGKLKDMPDGKYNGTEAERKQYGRKRSAVRIRPKQRYVDRCKRGVGKCASCARPVVKGKNEVMFEWNHLDEATKRKGGLFGKFGGVAGLVHNCSNAATLAKVKHLLDAEMKKCNVLCSNCHHRHTNKYPRSVTKY